MLKIKKKKSQIFQQQNWNGMSKEGHQMGINWNKLVKFYTTLVTLLEL